VYAAGSINGTGICDFGEGITATGTVNSDNAVLVKHDSSGKAQWARTVTASPD
jgi:hypothetical protein